MNYDQLLNNFGQFGLAVLLGILIGLERELRGGKHFRVGLRDFVLFALLGASTTFLGLEYQMPWIIGLGFTGLLLLLLLQHFSRHRSDNKHGPGITTELAALITFFLGVIIQAGESELAIAIAIVTLGVLFPKAAIKEMSAAVHPREIKAVVLFLAISFIILPILPNQTLNHLATFESGVVSQLDTKTSRVTIEPSNGSLEPATQIEIFATGWEFLGSLVIDQSDTKSASGIFEGKGFDSVVVGQSVRSRKGPEVMFAVLSALNPYRIWLIVVLVSLVSFLGYVLIKLMGSRAGIGLTGLLGGLVSSTVTTLSFARRSQENTLAIPLFAAAIILASSIMFPRLIIEIGVFNSELMKGIFVPLVVMGVTGLLLAAYSFRNFRSDNNEQAPSVVFENPFSLKSAITFALVFATILAATQLATTYLGEAWLPVVAVVSGLTDADAIAFSISNLQRSGQISLDWASFNLVLGALSNTFMKLALVFSLGNRALFRQLLWSFLTIGGVGITTMLLYYDLGIFS
jgi:uncharacterized membrane protein (DUF4010 family)